ncbi:MAG: hypothetical protein NTW87_04930 [Planctomycetota bacterium]|nr:hypothetical protein [Planctomycetota bacterium]
MNDPRQGRLLVLLRCWAVAAVLITIAFLAVPSHRDFFERALRFALRHLH